MLQSSGDQAKTLFGERWETTIKIGLAISPIALFTESLLHYQRTSNITYLKVRFFPTTTCRDLMIATVFLCASKPQITCIDDT